MGKSITCSDGAVFKNHAAYIVSKQWEAKRQEFFSSIRFWGCCVVCGAKKKLQVHHMHYRNIGNEKIEDLTCLCAKCHKKHHGIETKKNEKPVQRKKKKKGKKRMWKVSESGFYGSTKIFTQAEIEEYERQMHHMRSIQDERR
jgi:hypothetical protein